MTREEKIEQYLREPVKVGDDVQVRGLGSQDKQKWGNCTQVHSLGENGSIYIEQYGYRELINVAKGDYMKNSYHIGYNPFPDKTWNSSMRVVAFDLGSIIFGFFNRRVQKFSVENIGDLIVPELNWNPSIVDKDGNEVEYQRDFCWSLEDKQLLIESIYNNVDIGKIVVRSRSYEWVKAKAAKGKVTGFKDVVDGKQRLNAIIGFIKGEFKDKNGYYWDDLSESAKRKFENFHSVAYGELGENATDEDVKAVFLGVNFTGVQMSQEHINFVKSIQLKS